jgi:plastocyanin
MKTRASGVFLAALAIAITAYACGGSDNPAPPTTPTPNPPQTGPAPMTQTVSITGSGLSTRSIDVAVGGTVTFVNNDNRAHEMSSNPHPAHTDCPALNVGNLNPGESRATAAITVARSCGMHDHQNPGTASLQATLTFR